MTNIKKKTVQFLEAMIVEQQQYRKNKWRNFRTARHTSRASSSERLS